MAKKVAKKTKAAKKNRKKTTKNKTRTGPTLKPGERAQLAPEEMEELNRLTMRWVNKDGGLEDGCPPEIEARIRLLQETRKREAEMTGSGKRPPKPKPGQKRVQMTEYAINVGGTRYLKMKPRRKI